MRKNLLFKLIALLAAILLSQAVNSAGNSSAMTLETQIELKNIPDGKIVVRPTKPGVKFTIKGPSFLVGPLAAHPPPFRVRLPAGVGESVVVSLTHRDIALPPSVELLSIEPAEMEFELEQLEDKVVPVVVPRIGQLPKNLSLEGVVVAPPTVTVRGPRSELLTLRAIEAQPLNLAEVEDAKIVQLELELRPPPGKIILSEERVAVSVQVGETISQREFLGRPVEIRTAPDVGAVRIEPTLVKVILSGPGNVLSALSVTDIVPFIRLQRAPEVSGSDLVVRIEPPVKTNLVRVEPSTVRVLRGMAKAPAEGAKVKASPAKK